MASFRPMDSFNTIDGIMRRHGATCDIAHFHDAVNVAFHNFEAEDYDNIHRDMWESLPPQFSLLVDDCLSAHPALPPRIRMLDIGCGTGLASDSILKTPLRDRIETIDLVDSSPVMLKRAGERAAQWGKPVTTHLGYLDALPSANSYELIIISSVLHHVPDLPKFLAAVRAHQAHNGVFLHIQDPNGDYLDHPDLLDRQSKVTQKSLPEWIARLAPQRIAARLYRELTGRQGQDLVTKTNSVLLANHVINSPLTPHEVYSITDIQVQNGQGISLARVEGWLRDYECLSTRSYGFFGPLPGALPPQYRQEEERLIAQRAQTGAFVGAAWRLLPTS